MGVRAGIAFLAVSALACSSSTEFEDIRSQLNEIQFEILQLRKQSPSKAEVAEMEAGVSGQVGELRRSEEETQRVLDELSRHIQQLETKLQDTTFRLTQLAQRIEATNQELQAVRNATEVARAVPAAPPRAPNPTDPQVLYDTAYNDYVRGSYDLAILGFREYLEDHRDADLADNATYWIGECYLRQNQYQKAIGQFDEVLTRYDSSDRSPSALLKKGYAYLDLGQQPQGVVQLQNVICEYAGTDEAHLAAQRLGSLGIDADCEGP